MDTKNIKDEQIRKQIITASEVYRDKLAGRVFLYVYGESYFEVVFPTDRFRHLTGVNSSISAQEFYDKAKSSMLSAGQIFYDREHTYRGAKRKLPCLTMLPALTNNVVCVVKDMKTVTLTYKIGVTNLDFTIGLSENLDLEGNKINDWFLPRTLRVKDKAIESSADAEFIDFIFSKDASVDKYSTMTYADKDKKPPLVIKDFLSDDLVKYLFLEASNPVPTPLSGHRCRSSQEITGSPTPFSTSNHYLWICASASFSLSNPNIAA